MFRTSASKHVELDNTSKSHNLPHICEFANCDVFVVRRMSCNSAAGCSGADSICYVLGRFPRAPRHTSGRHQLGRGPPSPRGAAPPGREAALHRGRPSIGAHGREMACAIVAALFAPGPPLGCERACSVLAVRGSSGRSGECFGAGADGVAPWCAARQISRALCGQVLGHSGAPPALGFGVVST